MNIDRKAILPAIGLSLAAGAALSMALKPKTGIKDMKRKAGKALHSVGEMVEDLSNTMQM